MYEGRRDEGIEADKGKPGIFYNNALIKFLWNRKEKATSNYITNLEVAEQKLLQLQTRQKYTAKRLKEAKQEVCTLPRQCNNPVTLY